MTRTIVGVLRGGTSNEYPLSLKTGAAMINALPEEQYEIRDILIDKSGMWHLRGAPSTPVRALSQVDVVLSALHGGVGEDGTIHRLLDRIGVPYAGSSALASGISLNKIRARELLQRSGVRMPRAISFTLQNDLNTADMAKVVFAQFGPPYMVKPPNDGAGHGIRVARHLAELPDLLADVLDAYGSALVEEYIRGKEASIGVIADFRGEQLYVLPPSHVDHDFLHLMPEHHESGILQHRVPSSFSPEQKSALVELARLAHKALGLGHFSRMDAMVTPRTVYLLEVNSNPGLYPGSSYPPMLESVGSSVREFLEHAIRLALAKQ